MVAVFSSTTEMADRSRPTERQEHPTGEMFTVDDTWKARVKSELLARGMSQADLATAIDASPGAITGLLKSAKAGGVVQSRLVGRITKLFGWVDTTVAVVASPNEANMKRIARKWPALSPDEQAMIASLVDSLASKR
jgi:hypothetical protein